jgi:ABC-type uncharacterized transport system substrate-binding protein
MMAAGILRGETLFSEQEKKRQKKLALFQFSDHALLQESADGIMDELEQSNILKKYNIKVDRKNAQNEFTIAQSIVQEMVNKSYDYIITLSTPALQVTAQGNKKIPHIFGTVTDPYRMGVAENNQDHLPQLTGVATLQPVEATLRVMREIFPDAKKLGIVWNPAEACSEACTFKAREAAAKYGFKLVEATVSSTTEVLDAVKSLLSKDIELFISSGDNTVLLALDSIAAIMEKNSIPYFTNSPTDIERGTFLSVGADYYEVGRQTAKIAVRVISGEKTKDIPIKDYAPEKMYINFKLAEKYNIIIPDAVIKRAANKKHNQ